MDDAKRLFAVAASKDEAETIQAAGPALLTLVALHLRASHYTIIVGFVVYCWDILLTLDEERVLLWAKGGVLIKVLYLTNRYLPFVGLLLIVYANNPVRTDDLTDPTCKAVFILTQICQAIEIVVATSIFVVRIHTIYEGRKTAQLTLLFTHFVSTTALLFLVGIACANIAQSNFYSRTIRSCVGTPSTVGGMTYLAPIFIESVIVIMTLAHAMRRRDVDLGMTTARTLLRTLYLDGFLYYLIVFSLRLTTLMIWFLGAESLIMLMPYLEYALTSTVTSRWFLSFRRVLMNTFSPNSTESQNTSQPFTSPSIDFAPQRSIGLEGGRRIQRRSIGLDSFPLRSRNSPSAKTRSNPDA